MAAVMRRRPSDPAPALAALARGVPVDDLGLRPRCKVCGLARPHKGEICALCLKAALCRCCRRRPRQVGRPICTVCETARVTGQTRTRQSRIPPEAQCTFCHVRYAQDGRLCRRCARATGADLESHRTDPGLGRPYHKGAFCPIRPYVERTQQIPDGHGRVIEVIVMWDGRRGALDRRAPVVPDSPDLTPDHL
jgi:hypothetical protein